MYSLATLPSATTLIASTSEWSSPIFNDLLPFAIVIIGIALGVGLVLLLIKGLTSIFR